MVHTISNPEGEPIFELDAEEKVEFENLLNLAVRKYMDIKKAGGDPNTDDIMKELMNELNEKKGGDYFSYTPNTPGLDRILTFSLKFRKEFKDKKEAAYTKEKTANQAAREKRRLKGKLDPLDIPTRRKDPGAARRDFLLPKDELPDIY